MCSWYVDIFLIFSLVFNASLGQSLEQSDYVSPLHSVLQLLDQFTNYTEGNICCLNGQWESNSFLDYGAALNVPDATSFFHYNGTGKIAFDVVHKKSYEQFKITAFSPQIPVYSQFTTTTIKDFNLGIMYDIDDEGHCTKETIPKDIQALCIPAEAIYLSKGLIGKEVISTYQFSKSYTGTRQIVTAAVLRIGNTCDPVRVSQSVIHSKDVTHGTLLNLDVMDIKQGISDPSIFLPPQSCYSIR